MLDFVGVLHMPWCKDMQIFQLTIISAFVGLKPALQITPIHLAKSASSEVKTVLKKVIKEWKFKTEYSLLMNNIARNLSIVAIWQMKWSNITFIEKTIYSVYTCKKAFYSGYIIHY